MKMRLHGVASKRRAMTPVARKPGPARGHILARATICVVAAILASPAAAQNIEQRVSSSIESGRIFRDQGKIVHEGPTIIVDYTARVDGWSATYWRAETGNRQTEETDICIGKAGNAMERAAYRIRLCMIEMVGPEAVHASASLDHALSDRWMLTGGMKVMRGGFRTETGYIGLAFADRAMGINAGVSYDTWSSDTVLQAGAGVSLPFLRASRLQVRCRVSSSSTRATSPGRAPEAGSSAASACA